VPAPVLAWELEPAQELARELEPAQGLEVQARELARAQKFEVVRAQARGLVRRLP
jgi:hypothetical protein